MVKDFFSSEICPIKKNKMRKHLGLLGIKYFNAIVLEYHGI
jgi:hypothetical protein